MQFTLDPFLEWIKKAAPAKTGATFKPCRADRISPAIQSKLYFSCHTEQTVFLLPYRADGISLILPQQRYVACHYEAFAVLG